MRTKEPTTVQWVCVCCFVAHCNGDLCQCPPEDHPAGVMGLFEGLEPTAGMLREEHDCHADDCESDECEQECERPDECDCETNTFSTSSCDGCGSRLHGERHAVTGWV